MNLAVLFFLSVMIEGLVTYGSTICKAGKCEWKMLLSVVLGILMAVNFKLDIFEMLGMSSTIPYMSKILTGIIIGRGSNYVADLLKTMQNFWGRGSGIS